MIFDRGYGLKLLRRFPPDGDPVHQTHARLRHENIVNKGRAITSKKRVARSVVRVKSAELSFFQEHLDFPTIFVLSGRAVWSHGLDVLVGERHILDMTRIEVREHQRGVSLGEGTNDLLEEGLESPADGQPLFDFLLWSRRPRWEVQNNERHKDCSEL